MHHDITKPRPAVLLQLVLAVLVLAHGMTGAGCAGRGERQRASVRTPQTDRAMLLTARATELIDEGELDEAQDLLEDALAADVTYGPAHNNLGLVFYHQGRLYEAAWRFEYAIKLMPHFPEPRNNLGLVFERIGRVDEAIARYSEARELAPDNPEFLGNLGRAFIRKGERGEEAREVLSELLLKDQRPEWVEWAREQLARLRDDPPDADVAAPDAEPATTKTTTQ